MNGTIRDACGWPVPPRGAASELDKDVEAAVAAMQYLDLISYPLFLLLAIVGNTLNLTILCADQRSQNHASKNTYLVAIALCDLFYMLWSVFSYIFNYDGQLNGGPSAAVQLTNDRIAGVVMFFQEALAISSAWLIVAFSVERFVAIRWPLKHLSVAQKKRITLVTSGILLLAVLFTVVRLIDYYRLFALYINLEPKPARKPPRPPWLLAWFITYLYGQAINQVLTFLTILVLNTCLLKTILRQRRKRRDTLQANVSTHSQPGNGRHNGNTPGIIATPSAPNKAWSTLPLLASCVILYLVTQTPTLVDHVIFLLEKSCAHQSDQHVKMLLNPVQNILLNINHSVNFLLYCGVDERFRRRLWKITNVCLLPVTRSRRQEEAPRHGPAVATTVSSHTKSSSVFGSIKSLHLH